VQLLGARLFLVTALGSGVDHAGGLAERPLGVHRASARDHDADGDGDAAGDLPAGRARAAISVMAAAMGVGVPLGPDPGRLAAGPLLVGSVFLVNVPVALIGMAAPVAFIPESRNPHARPADLLGGVLSTVGLVAVVYGVIEAPRRGWGDGVSGPRSHRAGAAARFVLWERRYAVPHD
jgi:hypothetical protein